MAGVFSKDMLSWYLITLKIKETLGENFKKSPSLQWQSLNGTLPGGGGGGGGGEALPWSEWVVNIRGKLEHAREEQAACPWARLSVYHVPKSLREGDDRAYMPQVVSIGPLHAGKQPLSEMERHKWRALHQVLKRTGHDVTTYLDALRPMEDRVRGSYDGRAAWMPSNEFVQCLVLDGTFVLELFRGALDGGKGFAHDLGYSHNDPVFAMRGAMHAVCNDMILLENQIPLFVLDLLLKIQLGHPEQRGAVARLAVRFFDPLMAFNTQMHSKDTSRLDSFMNSVEASFDPLSTNPMVHCLDVFRRSLLHVHPMLQPTPAPQLRLKKRDRQPRDRQPRERQELVHCVSELREAGIRCRRRNTDRFWDIRFDKGVLHIPRILIHDSTKSMFLNMIAFEQCHMDVATPGGNSITSYAIFMDNLINTAEDVKYLHDQGIIEHWLGSDAEVAELFNRLCLETVFETKDSYLSKLSVQVNRYYDDKWSTWLASLQHDYFTNPWKAISIVAGVILLLLTMTQTFYSAYSYYRPPP